MKSVKSKLMKQRTDIYRGEKWDVYKFADLLIALILVVVSISNTEPPVIRHPLRKITYHSCGLPFKTTNKSVHKDFKPILEENKRNQSEPEVINKHQYGIDQYNKLSETDEKLQEANGETTNINLLQETMPNDESYFKYIPNKEKIVVFFPEMPFFRQADLVYRENFYN